MLYRKAMEKLRQWKGQRRKKALCVVGARQIGKTTLIREFAKQNYAYFAELNFILEPMAKDIFEGALDADTIVTNLTAYLRTPLVPGETLILLDEIQECPNARTAIKFLVEDGRFDYIESGSLLGIRSKNVRSMPVGFEEIYRMYPMDFEEFLRANGVQQSTFDYLRGCFEEKRQVQVPVHETLIKLFYNYIIVGGMPNVVQIFVDTHDVGAVIAEQRDILESYRSDIAKYADNTDKPKIRDIFDSIPAQLNDKNRRYMLSHIDKNARQLRYEDSFTWLKDAGVALPCYNVAAPVAPLMLNEKHNLFKLFLCDTGLLCAACMENVQFDILQGNLDVNLGSILENMMAQQLHTNGYPLYYFDTKKYGEVDFVIQNGRKIGLVEVKSGKDYKKHPAADKILSVAEWKIPEAVVLCKGNVERAEKFIYLPWYMVTFLTPQQPPESLKVEVDLGGLSK